MMLIPGILCLVFPQGFRVLLDWEICVLQVGKVLKHCFMR